MAIFLASFDIKAVSHDYGSLYANLRAADAHQAHASAWMIESDMLLSDLSSHLLSMMDKDDSLLLIEINSSTRWAATHLSEQTGEWLLKRRP